MKEDYQQTSLVNSRRYERRTEKTKEGINNILILKNLVKILNPAGSRTDESLATREFSFSTLQRRPMRIWQE